MRPVRNAVGHPFPVQLPQPLYVIVKIKITHTHNTTRRTPPMKMKMGWRWYGEGNDPITLDDIRQIPGVESIVWALHDKMPGEVWQEDEIKKVVDLIHSKGF